MHGSGKNSQTTILCLELKSASSAGAPTVVPSAPGKISKSTTTLPPVIGAGAWCEQATESIGKANGLDLTHCVPPTDISTECTGGRLTRDAIRQPGPLVSYA